MPDRRALKPGDRIRIIAIPEQDLEQRRRQQRAGRRIDKDMDTIRILQKLRDKRRVCVIREIDEWGYPWIDYVFKNKQGRWEDHSLAIMDDASWAYVDQSE